MLVLLDIVVKCLITNDSNLICTKTKKWNKFIHVIGKFKDILQARLSFRGSSNVIGASLSLLNFSALISTSLHTLALFYPAIENAWHIMGR